MLSISFRQIEYAVAIRKFGGVAAAAEAINVTQPALSTAIAKLEDHLGKPLFIRRKGSAAIPTSYGVEFLDEAQNILLKFSNLMDGVDKNNYKTTRVNIGCFVDLAPVFLGPIITALKEKFPEIIIHPVIGDFEKLLDDLNNGSIDFAITYNLGIDANFKSEELLNLSPYVLVGNNHPFHKKKSVTMKEIAEENLVLTDQELSIRHMVGLFHEHNLNVQITHKVPTFEMMRSFVANGLGVGLSYTQPKSNTSYDGKEIHNVKINDCHSTEPVILLSNKLNPLSVSLKQITQAVKEIYL